MTRLAKFARFMQWFCVAFFFFDMGTTAWNAVSGRWGWMVVTLSCTAFMIAMWRVNGKVVESEESLRLERELWDG